MKKKKKIEQINNIPIYEKKENHDKWIKKQQTFTNLSSDELNSISSQLWIPNKIDGKTDETKCNSSKNGILTKIDTNSWFKINKITKSEKINNSINNISNYNCCLPCNVYNKYAKNNEEKTTNILEKEKNFPDKIKDILNQQKIIDDSPEKFNPLKKAFKKNKKKEVLFNEEKKACKFIITCTYNNIIYGRFCGNICINSNLCKDHKKKENKECELFALHTCQHIITQKSGGKNGNEVVDRKGMKCNEFTFKSNNKKYCEIHSKSHKNENLENEKTTQRTFKINIFPTKYQKQKLEKYFGGERKTYNLCVQNKAIKYLSVKEANKKYVTDIWKTNEELNIDKIDENNKVKIEHINNINDYRYLKDIPKDIRSFTLRQYYTNCENAEDMYNLKIKNENYKRENYLNYIPKSINKPKITLRKKKDTQCINIDKNAIHINDKKIKIYPNAFDNDLIKIRSRQCKKDKKLKKILEREENINHDVKLIKTTTNKYYLCITIDCKIKEEHKITKVGAIDPNFRNLGTTYSEDESYEFGNDIYDSLIPMINKRNNLQNIYAQNIEKFKKKTINKNTYEQSKMNYRKYEQKIKNRIDDLHYKVITKLVEEKYSLILIPKLNIKKIMENETIHPMTKQIGKIESHMKFINRLIHKSELYGIKVKIINENMTSQVCGMCHSTYKFKGEIYNCNKCGSIIGRDINSSRNIYIKELCKLFEFTKYLETLN